MGLLTLALFLILILGAGWLLIPTLSPPNSPRLGLAAAVMLAFALVGALFAAGLVGESLRPADGLPLALIIGAGIVVLLRRRGAESAPRRVGAREIAFFALGLAVFAAPLLVLPVPLDTDAQGFGYLALMQRESGSLSTLAPFHPEIEYLYAPGFLTLAAALSRLADGLHTAQLAAAAGLGLIFLLLLWDFGQTAADWLDPGREGEPPARHTGAALALMGLLGLGTLTAYMDSHYTTLLALVFALAFLSFITRWLRGGHIRDALLAALTLAAVPLTHPDTTLILILGYVPWLGTVWLAEPRPAFRRWLGMAAGVPLLALLLITPWLARIAPLLGSGIASPFEIDPTHWRTLVFMHGGLIVPLAIGGAVLALRRRSPLDVLMVGWLLFVVDFSTTGVLERLLPGLLEPLLKYDYPFSIAWHGPIIPYAYLAARFLLWLAARTGWRRVRRGFDRLAWPALGIAAVGLALGVIFAEPLLAASKGVISFYGAFSSHADVAAMRWLRDNAPPDALILNFPGPQEGDWAPVISERDTVYFRPQPFFRGVEDAEAVQAALYPFWQDPADPAHASLLAEYGVDYVLVPQVVGNPDAWPRLWRWQPPFTDAVEMQSDVGDAAYLVRVADFDGAAVYAVP